MHSIYTQIRSPRLPVIHELGLKTQKLIGRNLDLGLYEEVRQLKEIDRYLAWLLIQHKAAGSSTHYIWHTQDDGKVRADHAANNGKIFAWDNPPETGNPGDDYNCRCWAGPVEANEYANQLLIGEVNDNPKKWRR